MKLTFTYVRRVAVSCEADGTTLRHVTSELPLRPGNRHWGEYVKRFAMTGTNRLNRVGSEPT